MSFIKCLNVCYALLEQNESVVGFYKGKNKSFKSVALVNLEA